MFLSEGYVTENTEMGYDPIYAMQVMQEATDDWNDICMKMIKLEHTAIMKEDAELLAEGAKEALTRFKNNLTVLGKKLIEYLERVRVQWSKLQASIATKFINTNVVEAVLKNYKGNAKLVYSKKDWEKSVGRVDNMTKATGDLVSALTKAIGQARSLDRVDNVGKVGGSQLSEHDEDIDAVIERVLKSTGFETFSEESAETVTVDDVKKAITFLKKRPVAIKNIETMKKAVTVVMNAQIKEQDKTDKPAQRNYLVNLQRAFNKMIISINKSTTTATKMISAAKPNKQNGVTQKAWNTAVDNDRKTKGGAFYEVDGKVKKESVLDIFG